VVPQGAGFIAVTAGGKPAHGAIPGVADDRGTSRKALEKSTFYHVVASPRH
jgi:hypothetical protein